MASHSRSPARPQVILAARRLRSRPRFSGRPSVEGIAEPVYFGGRVVGSVQRYSDACLIALLNAYRPERFRHRQKRPGNGARIDPVARLRQD